MVKAGINAATLRLISQRGNPRVDWSKKRACWDEIRPHKLAEKRLEEESCVASEDTYMCYSDCWHQVRYLLSCNKTSTDNDILSFP